MAWEGHLRWMGAGGRGTVAYGLGRYMVQMGIGVLVGAKSRLAGERYSVCWKGIRWGQLARGAGPGEE